jgi:phage shock protein A
MGIFSRFTDIVNSNINAILDRAEDPEKLVRLMIQEMEDTLVEVRSSAARAIADKKELKRKLGSLEADEVEWKKKAELAVDKHRDDLARAALAEKARVGESLRILRAQHEVAAEALARLNADIARLEEKLADARARQQTILARHQTARKQLEVRKRLNDYRIDDALVRFEQFERRMETLEGQVEAYDLGRGKDLNQEFSELEAEDAVEMEFRELKSKRAGSRDADEETAE